MAGTIPPSLKANAAFKEDLKRFLGLSPEQWHGFRLIAGDLSADVDEEMRQALRAVVPDISKDEAAQLAHVLRFAITRATQDGVHLDELVSDLLRLVDTSLDDANTEAFKAAITPTVFEIMEQKAVAAFSFGNVYMNVYTQPILAPGQTEPAVLYAGGSVSFTARAPGGTKKVLSFHASAGELREVARKLLATADKADLLAASVQRLDA